MQQPPPGRHQDAYPRSLSGRQHQRIAIIQTLTIDPSRLLFDEPTSALDPADVDTDVMATLAESGATILVVTHTVWFGRIAADRVVFIKDRTGS